VVIYNCHAHAWSHPHIHKNKHIIKCSTHTAGSYCRVHMPEYFPHLEKQKVRAGCFACLSLSLDILGLGSWHAIKQKGADRCGESKLSLRQISTRNITWLMSGKGTHINITPTSTVVAQTGPCLEGEPTSRGSPCQTLALSGIRAVDHTWLITYHLTSP